MRPVTELLAAAWRRKQQKRTVYVGSHEDRLSRLSSMHIDPDDDGRTRDDVEHQQGEGRGPYAGGSGGLGQ